MATALGGTEPGEVDGLPVTAQAARELAREASRWRWLRTSPHTGEVTDLTSTRYTPPATLKTFVQVRDRTCRYPGCTRQARRCDVDHRIAWPQGTTCEETATACAGDIIAPNMKVDGKSGRSHPVGSNGLAHSASVTWCRRNLRRIPIRRPFSRLYPCGLRGRCRAGLIGGCW
jgi:hypothetical protein